MLWICQSYRVDWRLVLGSEELANGAVQLCFAKQRHKSERGCDQLLGVELHDDNIVQACCCLKVSDS